MSDDASAVQGESPSRSSRPQHHDKVQMYESVLAGLSAGVSGTVIGYPLDTIKTRQQVFSKEYKPGSSPSMWKMSVSILRNEGIPGFFKGLMTPLVSISFLSSATFASYTWIQYQIGAQKGWDVRNALAAGVTAPFMVPITALEGLVRTQMQVDNVKKNQYRGSWHCLKTISKVHGVSTLFTGATVTLWRDVAYLCTYFYVYEGLKATLTGNGSQNDFFTLRPEIAVPLSGGTSGALSWFASLPFECVRAGVQGQNLETTPRKTALQVYRELMESRGFRALYRGATPTIMRAVIVSSTRFSFYEMTLWLLRRNEGPE